MSPFEGRHLVVILLMLVFAGLGLAMLHASGVHMKINAFRRSSVLLDCASENGLKRGLVDLSEWLEDRGPPGPASRRSASTACATIPRPRSPPPRGRPGRRLSPDARGILRRHALGEPGRLRLPADSKTGATTCGSRPRLRIEASGGLLHVPAPARLRPRGLAGAPGRTPAPAGRPPLYKERRARTGDPAAFLEENGISLARKPGSVRRDRAWPRRRKASSRTIPGPLVAKALGVGVFEPGDLSPAELRSALGLEPSTEPGPRRRLSHPRTTSASAASSSRATSTR
ncbi:MAG: hypothetical protein MZU91_10610 [Desulfosudis oleivorans]|nr:hypothetical protein [Desulfosudis oleivorans]